MKQAATILARAAFLVAGIAGVINVAAMPVFAATNDSVSSWTATNDLPASWAGASAVVFDGYIYVMGGSAATYNRDVYVAPINTDGSIGTWTTHTNAMPVGLTDSTVVIHNNYVYVIGGWNGSGQVVDNVYYAQLGANGSIGTWTDDTTNPLPQALGYGSSVVYNDRVYVVGGDSSGGTNLDTVYYNTFNTDGSLGAWQTSANALPVGSAGLRSVEVNGYIYALGGFASGSIINNVQYAKVNTDGSIGTWTDDTTNPLPAALEFAAVYTHDGYMYIADGYGTSGVTQNVYYNKPNTDGSPGAWITNSNATPTPVAHPAYALYNNTYIYALGGSGDSGTPVYASVYYATVTTPAVPSSGSSSGSNSGPSSLSNVPGSPDTGSGKPMPKHSLVLLAAISSSVVVSGVSLLRRAKPDKAAY